MASVKDAIEEMIEESYLLGLSEDEIREDFRRRFDGDKEVSRLLSAYAAA